MSGGRLAVVTGGAGFIGSHLVDRLLADGWRVTAIDNGSVGRPQNLAHHAKNPALTAVWADVADHAKIAPHFAGAERVFHLAALADIVPSIERPTDYFRSNVVGTESVLEAARAAQVKRFVYAASSSCYGIPDKYPTPETAPIQPQYPYALTKRLGEELVLHWGQVYGMPVVSTRFFNVYGPRARTSGTYGAVFGVFLKQKLAGKPFTVVGDGTQGRDFLYVTDVARAFLMAAETPLSGRIWNVGAGNPQSVNHLVELLGGPFVHIPKRPGEPDCTWADISLVGADLGWKPEVSFEAGVATVVANIDYWRDAPLWDPDSIAKSTASWFAYLDADR